MAKYIIASTESGARGIRPWQSRLMGDYQHAQVVIPTQSYANLPTPGAVTGGLGIDLSAIPPWVILVGALGLGWMLLKPKR